MLVLLFAGTYANGYMESKHFDLFTEAKEALCQITLVII